MSSLCFIFCHQPFLFRTHADSAKSTSSETDCNDNVPSHKNPASSQSKHGVNGFFQQQSMYDSPPPRATSVSIDSSLYYLPRSYSHDVLPKVSPSSTEADGELYVFNTPSGTSSLETQLRHVSVSYDIPSTPGNTYQIPRTFPEGTLGQTSKLDTIPDIPPPRPPKPHPAHDRSPVETCSVPRAASDPDSSYCVPTAGVPQSRSNTISTLDLNKLRKGQRSLAPFLLRVHDGEAVFPSSCSSKHSRMSHGGPLLFRPASQWPAGGVKIAESQQIPGRVFVHTARACVRGQPEGGRTWRFPSLKEYGLSNSFLPGDGCPPFPLSINTAGRDPLLGQRSRKWAGHPASATQTPSCACVPLRPLLRVTSIGLHFLLST